MANSSVEQASQQPAPAEVEDLSAKATAKLVGDISSITNRKGIAIDGPEYGGTAFQDVVNTTPRWINHAKRSIAFNQRSLIQATPSPLVL